MSLHPLRFAREVAEVTAAELAETSGLHETAISKIENRARPVGIENARRLADALIGTKKSKRGENLRFRLMLLYPEEVK